MSSFRPPRGRGTTLVPPTWDTPKGPDLSYIGAVARYASSLSLTKRTIPGDIEGRVELLLDKIASGQFKDRENYQVVAYASALEKEGDGTLLGLVLDLIFRTLYKYDSGGAVAATYAELCELLVQEILPNVQDGTTLDSTGIPIKGARLARHYLLDRCHSELSITWAAKEKSTVFSVANPGDSAARAAEAGATDHWIKLARFVGQLHNARLIPPSVIHQCIEKLVSGLNPTKSEAETICRLIKDAAEPSGAKAYMDAHYLRIHQIVNNASLDPKVKFILQTWIHPWQLSDGDTLRFNQQTESMPSAPAKLVEFNHADPYNVLDITNTPPMNGASGETLPPEVLSPPVPGIADDTFEITANTPLNLVVAFFKKITRLTDYTSQLEQADCSSQPLAEGGSSEVYRATLRKDTHLAVKCMRPSYITGDSKVVKRTARELDSWSQLRHDNILELLGLALFKGRLAMVSAWMELGNIVMLVNARPSMDRYKLVVGAVVYLHGMKIVHGDLKGANVLVSHDGKPKLADFGLTITQESKLRFSETDLAGGTLRWMAPEMFKPDGRRSTEADVYALGMTMLEILTGREPFPDVKSSWGVQGMVVNERRTPDRPEYLSVRSPLNDRFWKAMEKCWRYEPGDRARAVDVEELILAAEGYATQGSGM